MSASASRTRRALALGVEHPGITSIDRHAGADGRLCQVHWRDVAALEVGERVGQFGLERVEELAAGGGGRVSGARAADEDDAGGEGVGVHSSHSIAEFRPHRPCTADGEARADHRVEEGLPSGAGGAFGALALRLLEGVIDGDREGRMRLLGQAVHRLGHAVRKKASAFSLLPWR